MNILPQAAHRPSRRFPDAPRKILQPEVKECPYCGHKLKSTGNLYINREVQTMSGPLNVRAYGWCCGAETCSHPLVRYRARRSLWRISLPKCGYGLDVVAHIGWERDKNFRQFSEIQLDLQSRGIVISERHVGRLYRQYLSLLGGMTDLRLDELKGVNQSHGGIVLALDGLQPDKDGTTLYVLYEAISETTIAAAWIDKRDTEHLTNWLKPYSELDLTVLATLSDGEEAEIAALKGLWKNSPHQMCLTHFLGDCGKPIKDADQKLKSVLRQGMGQLPPVPGDKNSAKAGPAAATPVLSEPTTVHHTLHTPNPTSNNDTTTHDHTTNNHNTNSSIPTSCLDGTDAALPAEQQANNTQEPAATELSRPNTRKTSQKLVAEASDEISTQLPTSRSTEPQADEASLLHSHLSENNQAGLSSQQSVHSPIISPKTCANTDSQSDGKPSSPKTCANVDPQMESAECQNQAIGQQSHLAASLSTPDLIEKGKAYSNLYKPELPGDKTQIQPSYEGASTLTLNHSCLKDQKNEIEPEVALSELGPDQTQIKTQSILSSLETTSTVSTIEDQNKTSTTNQTQLVTDTDPEINQKQLRMREIEHLFRKSFQQTLNHPSRYPSSFGGWQGYQQLSGIIQAMDEHIPALGGSYLHRLYTCGQQALSQAAELANQVSESIDLLTELISLLFEPFSDSVRSSNKKSSTDVKKEVDNFIDARKEEDELAKAFISQTKRLIEKWEESLFNCYDIPALPPNNAALESRFNLLRRGQRRIHGRKKTSQLRRTAHLQLLLNASSVSELLEQLRQVSQDEYIKARVSLEAAEERQRQLARLRRKPYQTASALVLEYVELLNENIE